MPIKGLSVREEILIIFETHSNGVDLVVRMEIGLQNACHLRIENENWFSFISSMFPPATSKDDDLCCVGARTNKWTSLSESSARWIFLFN